MTKISKLASILALTLGMFACSMEADPVDDENDSFLLGKADGALVSEGSLEALGVLTLVNAANFEELDDAVGLDRRAAQNIVEHRNGVDALLGTDDDDAFDSLAELDDISYVGKRAFGRLVEYALAEGYVGQEPEPTIETDTALLRVANTLSRDALDDSAIVGLDRRAANAIVERRNGVDGRPRNYDDHLFATIEDLDATPYVGRVALDKLRAYAIANGYVTTELSAGVHTLGVCGLNQNSQETVYLRAAGDQVFIQDRERNLHRIAEDGSYTIELQDDCGVTRTETGTLSLSSEAIRVESKITSNYYNCDRGVRKAWRYERVKERYAEVNRATRLPEPCDMVELQVPLESVDNGNVRTFHLSEFRGRRTVAGPHVLFANNFGSYIELDEEGRFGDSFSDGNGWTHFYEGRVSDGLIELHEGRINGDSRNDYNYVGFYDAASY